MKLWVDDVRHAPDGYSRAYSTRQAISLIWSNEDCGTPYELIDIDHDAGDYAKYGGDYVNILNWLEETGRNYSIRIHSMNPVGAENMRRIIQRNGWIEIK